METTRTVWNLFLFAGLLGVPQFLGVLLYFRVRRYGDFVAHFAGFLVPPISFFILAGQIAFSSAARQAEAGVPSLCGTFAGIMSLAILLGAGLQTIFSLMAQMTLHSRHLKGAVRGKPMLRTNVSMLLAVSLLCCGVTAAQATTGGRSGPKFESAYTDLAKECKAAVKEGEAAEGQDVPQRCKGYGGYFASVGYTAFYTLVGVETEDGQTTIALSPGKGGELPGTKLEWRLADGKPFAVILRYSFYKEDDVAAGESPFKDKNKTGEALVVKGLRGYEQTINFVVDAKTPNANERARELADSAYPRGR